LSLRQIEELMAERGVVVDHATIHRGSIKMLPVLAAVFRRRKRTVGASWRMDETYVKISGEWQYLYRAVDRAGHTIDFLLRAHRNLAAARQFFERAIKRHGMPEKITIDKSGVNTAAIVDMCTDSGVDIDMRQSKYLNNLIEQDHRAIKRGVHLAGRPVRHDLASAQFWFSQLLIHREEPSDAERGRLNFGRVVAISAKADHGHSTTSSSKMTSSPGAARNPSATVDHIAPNHRHTGFRAGGVALSWRDFLGRGPRHRVRPFTRANSRSLQTAQNRFRIRHVDSRSRCRGRPGRNRDNACRATRGRLVRLNRHRPD